MKNPFSILAIPALVFAGIIGSSCQPHHAPPDTAARRVADAPVESTALVFEPAEIGEPVTGKPWIPHVRAIDLDGDGQLDIVACDARGNTVRWLRQDAHGNFTEEIIASGIPACVRAEPVDLDTDGDLDLVVASMGQVFPNNDRIGAVYVLINDGRQHFTSQVIAHDVPRVCDVQAGDFNADGKPDLAVAAFGYNQGEIFWLENLGEWEFRHHSLLPISGAINVCVADLNGDRKPDIAAVVSQEWEEIYLFENHGGTFTQKILWGANNEDFGSSGLAVADLNRDGRPDLVYTNGDGFDLAKPSARQWHGVQWLENLGQAQFRYHRIADLPGAYTPVIADFDGDNWPDIAVVSAFNDWQDPKSVSLALLHNDQGNHFTLHAIARTPTHLLALAAGDFDQNGRPELITGGFHAYPPFDRMSRLLHWRPVSKSSEP